MAIAAAVTVVAVVVVAVRAIIPAAANAPTKDNPVMARKVRPMARRMDSHFPAAHPLVQRQSVHLPAVAVAVVGGEGRDDPLL